MTSQDQQLRSLVDQFVTDLTVMIRQEALEAVREALGAPAAPKRRGPGRPRKTATRRGPGRPRKAAASKGGRRSPDDVAALGETVLAHVKSNPGQRLEEIGRELRIATKELKRPIANLMEGGSLRTEGQKRGTKYFAGKATGRRKAAKRKATKRKATKRKTTGARKKATRRKATRKRSSKQAA